VTFLEDIKLFIRNEKRYTFLLILILLFYAYVISYSMSQEKGEEADPARDRIEQMSERLEEDPEIPIRNLKHYFNENPLLVTVCGILILAMVSLFVAGLGFLFYYAYQKMRGIERIQATGPPRETKWFLGDVFKGVILLFAVIIVSQLILEFGNSAFFKGKAETITLLVHTIIVELFAVGVAFHTILKKYEGQWQDIGFGYNRLGGDIKLGVISYFAFLPIFAGVLITLAIIATIFNWQPEQHELIKIFLGEDVGMWVVALSLLVGCIAGPIVEECFFRGFFYPAVKKKWGLKWGMVVSAGLFAAIHGSSFALIPIFLLGLLLTYVYEKRRSLVPSIVIHITHNSIMMFYFFVMQSLFLTEVA